MPPSKSTLKFYVNDKDVWVCSTTVGQRVCGTITERTSPSLYKVNNQTWRRLVKKLQDSYLAPPRKETNDCFVPEIGKHVMPVVPETEQKEAPTQSLKANLNRALNQSWLPPTHHPQVWMLPARLQDFTCDLGGLYLWDCWTLFANQRTLSYFTFILFYVCFVSSHFEI